MFDFNFRTHGFDSEALKLALSIAVTLRHNQKRDHAQWLNNKENYAKFNCTASGVARKPGHASYEGWIGHSLNPIGILFNTLVEPCLYPDQDSGRLGHHLDLIPCKNTIYSDFFSTSDIFCFDLWISASGLPNFSLIFETFFYS